MFPQVRSFLLGIVVTVALLVGAYAAFAQDGPMPFAAPLVIDIQQEVPVHVDVILPVDDADGVTTTIPMTVGIALQVSLSGQSTSTVRALTPAAPASIDVAKADEGTAVDAKPAALSGDTIELTGSGQQATEEFSLMAGLARFEMEHDGKLFTATLLDQDGNYVDLLATDFDGQGEISKAANVEAGAYLLDIQSDGAWTVSIVQR